MNRGFAVKIEIVAFLKCREGRFLIRHSESDVIFEYKRYAFDRH